MISDDYYGDRYRWFVGVVKDVDDDLSRVRVRVFGIHHTEDVTKVSNGDLPWALVMYPTTGGQTSGGNASHGLKPGTWVVGFFADGEDSQQPIILGVINGGQNSMNASPQQGSNADRNDPNLYTSNPSTSNPSSTTPDSSGNIPSSTANGPSTTQLSGSGDDAKVFNYFWEKISAEGRASGNIKEICAATVGNIQAESGWNPQAWNGDDKSKMSGKSAPSGGICQWRGDPDMPSPKIGARLKKMLDFCGHNGAVGKGSLPPLEKQLDYLWHELHGDYKKQYGKIVSGTSVSECLEGWIAFEMPGGVWDAKNKCVNKSDPEWKRRLGYAQAAYSKLSYTGGSGGKS